MDENKEKETFKIYLDLLKSLVEFGEKGGDWHCIYAVSLSVIRDGLFEFKRFNLWYDPGTSYEADVRAFYNAATDTYNNWKIR